MEFKEILKQIRDGTYVFPEDADAQPVSDDCIETEVTLFRKMQNLNVVSNEDLLKLFNFYIKRLDGAKIHISGYDLSQTDKDKQKVKYSLDVAHRWTKQYKNKTLAKFYNLTNYFKNNGIRPPVTLFTLTMSSRDAYILDNFEMLEKGRRKIIDVIRKDYKGVQYLYVYEPHKSGYPHIHILVFAHIRKADEEKYKKLWTEKYKIGGYDDALQISRTTRINAIDNIKNYVLKYLQKTLYSDDNKKDFGYNLFSAAVHYMSRRNNRQHKGVRLFGGSQKVTRAMAIKKPKLDSWITECVDFETRDTISNIYYDRDILYKIYYYFDDLHKRLFGSPLVYIPKTI